MTPLNAVLELESEVAHDPHRGPGNDIDSADNDIDRTVGRELEISVVIATWRRPELLMRCLDAVLAQDLEPHRYEIVVCDDGPDSATEAAVLSLRRRVVEGCGPGPAPQRPAGPALRYLPVGATQGPAGARNVGWRSARGRLIAFTDDDTIPARTWLRQGLIAMADGAAAAAGCIEVPLPPWPTDYQLDAAGLAHAEFATANCFVRRDVLERIGGFDPRYTSAWREDSDLHFKILAAGLPLVVARDAVVVHPVRAARWGVSVAQQKKSQFEALLYKAHPRLYRHKVRFDAIRNYYLILLCLATALLGWAVAIPVLAWWGSILWLALTAQFTLRRLRRTSRQFSHIAEMAWTSIVIPPLSVFWRLYGAIKYRVLFL